MGLAAVLFGAASLLYPAIVYAVHDVVAPSAFIAAILLLIALRLATSGGSAERSWRWALVAVVVAMLIIGALDAVLAVRAYPVLMSLSVAAVFGVTLWRPPSLIERFARMRQPALPQGAVVYCRRLTVAWTGFLIFNAAVAGATALWADIIVWSLWTGLISYVLIAILFLGEMAVRPFLLRHKA